MPSIRTFKTFLAVARHGTFAAAGKEIGLTAAAVGLQIRALEAELNQELFDRGPRSVVLNTAGRKAVPQVEEILACYDALAHTGDSDELSGNVVMGALVSALMGAFADALWSLKRRHPKLKVQLFAGLSSDFALQVERGELDAAIVTQPPPRALASSLLWTPLYSEPMVLIVPRRPHFELPEEPLEALRRAPFVRFDRHTWTGHLVRDVLAEAGVSSRDELELNSVEAAVEIVRQGFGISIVPQLANVQWEKDRALRVIRVPGVTTERRVGLLERTQHRRMQFTAAIKAYFEENQPS
jgi:DNA-binding transcriptional LysR family regulator